MKPVFQKIICKERGDCFSACLASLLEVPLESVPSFNALAIDSGLNYPVSIAYNHIRDWLAGLGFTLMSTSFKQVHDYRSMLGQYALLTVPSQKFGPTCSHCVIGQYQWDPKHGPETAIKLFIVHDPNPGNAPYPDDLEPSLVKFLVPKSPSVDGMCHSFVELSRFQ